MHDEAFCASESGGNCSKKGQSVGWLGGLSEGRERMDLIKAAQPQWMNVNISDTARLDELFDHRDMSALGRFATFGPKIKTSAFPQ